MHCYKANIQMYFSLTLLIIMWFWFKKQNSHVYNFSCEDAKLCAPNDVLATGGRIIDMYRKFINLQSP